MQHQTLSKLATVLCGLVAANAIPVTLLARVPSSVPSGIAAGVSIPAAAPVSSNPVPPTVPSGSVPPVILSQAPSAPPIIPSQAPSQPPPVSSPPTTVAPPPTTTTTTPAPTWTIQVEVGQTQMNIGDADASTFLGLMTGACNANGCPDASPSFTYNGIDGAGHEASMSGNLGLVGNVNNDQTWVNDLLTAINVALLASVTCNTDSATSCGLKKRETPGVALDCGPVQLNQCSMANWVQATMYTGPAGTTSPMAGQITMSGTSEPDFDFDCTTMLSVMGAAATAADLDPPVQGAFALMSVICSLVSGS